MQYVIHIFAHWGNGLLYEVTSPGDWHEVIRALLRLAVCTMTKALILIFRGERWRTLTYTCTDTHKMLRSSRLPFIKIQLRAAAESAKSHWANVVPQPTHFFYFNISSYYFHTCSLLLIPSPLFPNLLQIILCLGSSVGFLQALLKVLAASEGIKSSFFNKRI